MAEEAVKNFGFIPREMTGADAQFGEQIIPNITDPSVRWSDYRSQQEVQYGVYFDPLSCVSASAVNILESLFNYHLAHSTISPDNVAWLNEKGYLVNGKVEFSVRFTAKMSGTTHQGNTGYNVAMSVRRDGLVPRALWPFPKEQRTPVFDWDDYYAQIPAEAIELGQEFARRFDILSKQFLIWDWLKNLPDKPVIVEALTHGPLQVFVHAWDQPVDGIYRRTPRGINHAVDKEKIEYHILDSYFDDGQANDYTKELATDFIFYPTAFLYVIREKTAPLAEGSYVKAPDDPKVYRIEGGAKRHLLDELTVFSIGKRLGNLNVIEVPASRLNAIPDGAVIKYEFKDLTLTPAALKEFMALFATNPAQAQAIYQRYFS